MSIEVATAGYWMVFAFFVSALTPVQGQAPHRTAEAGGQFEIWAIDDMTRINPETGLAFEADPVKLPGGLTGNYRQENSVWSETARTVDLAGARNEVVAFQLVIEGRGKDFTVEMTPWSGPSGRSIPSANSKLFREWYIWVPTSEARVRGEKGCVAPLTPGWFPDAAIPLSEAKIGNGFSIPSTDFHDVNAKKFPDQKNQSVWVDIHIPKAAAPGLHTATITVRNGAGESKSLPLRLKVWNLTIPSRMSQTAMLMDYGKTLREEAGLMMQYFKLAAEHRTFIVDLGLKPQYQNGDFVWGDTDTRLGPLFDGSAFTEGPTEGVPIPQWWISVDFHVQRPDKGGKKLTRGDWPIPAPKTPDGLGVQFTPEFSKNLVEALHKFEQHFIQKGWSHTRLFVLQDSHDEPGFWCKQGVERQAGEIQARDMYQTAKLIKDGGFRQMVYQMDIGSGFHGNALDLDGNGRAEGPVDVANYFGPVVKVFSIQGLCIDMKALRPQIDRHGTEVLFYNGFHPRVGPNTLHGELLGLRTWSVSAWRSGLTGWADWSFRNDTDLSWIGTKAQKVKRQMFHESTANGNRSFYFYRGEEIGKPGKLYASLRLKSMRRGEQDVELLRLLRRQDGNDKRAQSLAARVCGDSFVSLKTAPLGFRDDEAGSEKIYEGMPKEVHYSHDPAKWERFRRELGEALESSAFRHKP